MNDHTKIGEKITQIANLEHKADDHNDAIVDKLNQTFITPMDREDIYAMANMLDDGVDFIQGILERMMLYRTGKPSEGAVELSRLLSDCSEEIVKAFDLLKNINGNQHKILDHTRKVVVLESEGDRIYRQEVAHLFTSGGDTLEIIKWKEVLEYLEDALDHYEKIADLLRGVVMKYA
jgi:Phosphate transport regulator (distant homolog of PhoU)